MKPWYRYLNPYTWPIAAKLSAMLLAAALVPMNLTAYYNLQGSLASIRKTEFRNLELLANSTASRLDQIIGDTQQVVVGVTGDREVINFLSAPPAERDAYRQSVQQLLASTVKSNDNFASMFIIDKKGIGQASTNPKNIGQDLNFREYFQVAIRGDNYVSDFLVGTTSSRPGLYFSSPIRNERDEIIGVAVLKLQGENIWQIVDELRVGSQGCAFLVDQNGIVIGQPDKSTLYRSLAPLTPEQKAKIDPKTSFGIQEIQSLNMPEVANAMVGVKQSGHFSYSNNTIPCCCNLTQDKSIVVGFAPMKARSWVLGVSEPESEFAAPLEQLKMQTNLSVFAVGASVTVLALLLAQTIVKPIKKLTAAAATISQGDFENARVEVKLEDELGVLASAFNLMADGLRDRQRERDIFGRVVSPEVREQLLKGQLMLGGETRLCSVLFSDIRGFSTISEQMHPQEVVTLLNEYLTAMTNAIRPWGGYINNFIGDAILVVFGAPVDQPDKEWHAVAAALSMREALRELNQKRAARGEATIESGIGISTGEVVAGQVGSLERLMYTTIGDAVNVAARLETLTKDYSDNPILIEGRTAAAIAQRGDITIKTLGSMQVKGRFEAVEVYQVLGWTQPVLEVAKESSDRELNNVQQ